MMEKFIKIVLFVCLILLISGASFASAIEGTLTYDDYIFIFVQGITNNQYKVEDDQTIKNLMSNLENIGLQGRIFAYTFNLPGWGNEEHARELGDRNYTNKAKEFMRYITISRASLEELGGDIEDCFDDKLITRDEFSVLSKLFESANYMTNRYLVSLRKMDKEGTWKTPGKRL